MVGSQSVPVSRALLSGNFFVFYFFSASIPQNAADVLCTILVLLVLISVASTVSMILLNKPTSVSSLGELPVQVDGLDSRSTVANVKARRVFRHHHIQQWEF